MLKEAKKQTGLKGTALASFLGVTPATLFNWDKEGGKNWPLWALRKCGFEIVIKEAK